ncbi:hypothetical protein [Bacillus sp. 03113]|uniref:hypothetical protein n=1 Tax=Bacillus sp. 03113 TaxID=2578211 RepID=UPI00114229CE|nr:hypothetical protein [Bacillus sp. 03113]
MQAAFKLGVSQIAIETEYYMVDLPVLLEKKAKEHNDKVLEKVMIQLATNRRSLEEEEFNKFMKQLTSELNLNQSFSREKMEELRMMTNLGANKT